MAERSGTNIEVWYWRTNMVLSDLGAWSMMIERYGLSKAEQDRANRTTAPAQRLAFLASRVGLRTIIGRCLAREPRDVDITLGPHGKPVIEGGPHFNLSHAGDWAALAVCRDHPVGIDIERPRAVSRNLPRRFYSAAEASYLDELPADEWEDAFFRLWTRKEAVLKALGTGLSRDPRTFTALGDGTAVPVVWHGDRVDEQPRHLQLCRLEPPEPGYHGAVAVCATAPMSMTYATWHP